MTDKELLELAAKAAGYTLEDRYTKQDEYWPWCEEVDCIWNPLADDGDALRLAVKLGIHITSSVTDAWASALTVTAIEPMRDDPYAATRRAIVRAAAAIGRTM